MRGLLRQPYLCAAFEPAPFRAKEVEALALVPLQRGCAQVGTSPSDCGMRFAPTGPAKTINLDPPQTASISEKGLEHLGPLEVCTLVREPGMQSGALSSAHNDDNIDSSLNATANECMNSTSLVTFLCP